MHELSIAQTIIASVRHRATTHGYTGIEAIGVTIGELSDIVPEALSFAFEIITRDTDLHGVRLEITRTPIEALCEKCKTTFRVVNMQFVCPTCHAGNVRVTSGEELHIAYLDVGPDEQSIAKTRGNATNGVKA